MSTEENPHVAIELEEVSSYSFVIDTYIYCTTQQPRRERGKRLNLSVRFWDEDSLENNSNSSDSSTVQTSPLETSIEKSTNLDYKV